MVSCIADTDIGDKSAAGYSVPAYYGGVAFIHIGQRIRAM